jgi:hypothetical protein
VLNDAQFRERAAADAEQTSATFRTAIDHLIKRAEREYESSNPGTPPTLDLLALSGGGDYGAFGAGFLVGWGEASDPGLRRPDFDAVTGVSTGALLAPFAYVGTNEACRTVESFYRNPKQGWVEERGLLFFLPTNPSFMIVKLLEHDIGLAVNKDLVAQMAEQYRKDKILAISATDLDLGRQKIWELGGEAEAASASGNLDRLHLILMASAAIPAVFPAVSVDDSLYADGGVTANVLLRLDPHSPDSFLQRWRKAYPERPLPRVRYWVIINNQLHQPPKTVQPKWPGIVAPSLATAIRCATLAEVRWLAAEADFVNTKWGTDIEVRVTAIPDEWRAPVPGDFKKENMESLADLGRRMGADPKSWRVWASPADIEKVRSARSTEGYKAVPDDAVPMPPADGNR